MDSKCSLYVLYGGDIICKYANELNVGMDESGPIQLANPIFLIQHPKGLLLWDSGLPDSYINQPEGIDAWIFNLKMKTTVLSQLNSIGITPDDIDYFALSHCHNDHTGNAHYFLKSTLIIQEKEYQYAFHSYPLPYNYSEYEGFKNRNIKQLKGDFDLFGDGAIQFISTPGHTPGHQSLLVNLSETGYILISGDVSYYQKNYDNNGIPSFNYNPEQSLASIKRVKLLEQKYNAKLWIQHDKDNYEQLMKAPQFYQ